MVTRPSIRYGAAGLLALALLAACGGGGGGGPQPQTRLTLTGRVINAADAPLAGVAVLLGLSPATTDSSGSFSYADLLPGSYVISVQDSAGDFDCQQLELSATTTQFEFQLPDTGPGLRVESVTPLLNSTGAALDAPLTLTFNEALDPASVQPADFTITPGIGTLTAGVSGAVITLTPRLQLPRNQLILVELTGGIRSATDDALNQPLRWRFRTAATDTFPPHLIATDPAEGATDFPPNLGVSFEFNEQLGAVDAQVQVSSVPSLTLTARSAGRVLYVSPESDWTINTLFTVSISGVPDLAGNRELATLTLSFTTGATPAPHIDRQPYWSRALNLIVFSSNRLHSYDLFSIRPDGTELTRLTSEPTDELHPTLSNDGALIAYQAPGPQDDWDIWVGAFTPPLAAVPVTAPNFQDTQPAFSNTFSKEIVFVSSRSNPQGLFMMSADGSNPTELDPAFGSDQTEPALHPLLDTQLLFTSGASGSLNIWRKTISAIDGSAINFDLTPDTLSKEHAPAWAPDASFIIYLSDSGGEDNVWLSDAAGEFPRQVTFFDQPAADPAPSPTFGDMRCVLSLPNGAGGSDLVIVDLVGGGIISHLTGEEAGH